MPRKTATDTKLKYNGVIKNRYSITILRLMISWDFEPKKINEEKLSESRRLWLETNGVMKIKQTIRRGKNAERNWPGCCYLVVETWLTQWVGATSEYVEMWNFRNVYGQSEFVKLNEAYEWVV